MVGVVSTRSSGGSPFPISSPGVSPSCRLYPIRSSAWVCLRALLSMRLTSWPAVVSGSGPAPQMSGVWGASPPAPSCLPGRRHPQISFLCSDSFPLSSSTHAGCRCDQLSPGSQHTAGTTTAVKGGGGFCPQLAAHRPTSLPACVPLCLLGSPCGTTAYRLVPQQPEPRAPPLFGPLGELGCICPESAGSYPVIVMQVNLHSVKL